ncbi:MAG: 5'-nucleotidase C-terminal domain-containing protein [Acidobacteriota bacterium]
MSLPLIITLLTWLSASQSPDCKSGRASVGVNHTLIVSGQGDLYAWGLNTYGQLDVGGHENACSPVRVRLGNVVAVEAGLYHSLALTADGAVWFWGLPAAPALPAERGPFASRPARVDGLPPITAIAVGQEHNVALDREGGVWTWGANQFGQLGDGTTRPRLTPSKISLKGMVAIAAGSGHTLTVASDGTVWAFGRNPYGQIGDGTTTMRKFTPVQVFGLDSVTAVAAGYDFSLALRKDGTVWSWGRNAYGQLGDGTNLTRRAPVQVKGIPKVRQVAAGQLHALAVVEDRSVWGWGANECGQLGDGATVDQTKPVRVSRIVATDVAAGGSGSLAFDQAGKVWSWGHDPFGRSHIRPECIFVETGPSPSQRAGSVRRESGQNEKPVAPGDGRPPAAQPGSRYRHLTYVSAVDGTEQPYALYIPKSYDGTTPYPLVVLLHGTTGDERTFFDNPLYLEHPAMEAAERLGLILAAPYGRGPTDYRGQGEQDVFEVMSQVQAKYKIDADRIYLAGHSMGGTGAAYLALHHPDIFAAAAPLGCGSDYIWQRLAPNGRYLPLWFISGANDQKTFIASIEDGVRKMQALGNPVKYLLVQNEGHYGAVKDMHGVLTWLAQHRRIAAPREFTFVVDSPLHGRAYWTRVDQLTEPGRVGVIKARVHGNQVFLDPSGIRSFSLLPDPAVLPLNQTLKIVLNGQTFEERVREDEELCFRLSGNRWACRSEPFKTDYLTRRWRVPVGSARAQLDMRGIEAPLANWMTDAMRKATGADVALLSRQYFRGEPFRRGPICVADLLDCLSADARLAVARLTGRQIEAILDENVPNPANDRDYITDGPEASRLLQISGARYTFDRSQPPGRRVVQTSLVPDRVYSVVIDADTFMGDQKRIAMSEPGVKFQVTESTLMLAVYGFAARSGIVSGRVEGRVRERVECGLEAKSGDQ